MPHSLTKRQKEYLEYIREYIAKNECSPRLEELAKHFYVKSPTAHKTLKAIQKKGYLYFGRDSISGFFIRLIERAGSTEIVLEVPTIGKVNKYGEIYKFPKKIGHFASVFSGAKPSEVFALAVMDDIPQSNILSQDLIIFDIGKEPQPGDICIFNWEHWLLIRVCSYTFDRNTISFETDLPYPIPENLKKKDLEQWLNWIPLAYDDDTSDYFQELADREGLPMVPIPPDFVVATALRLTRTLAY